MVALGRAADVKIQIRLGEGSLDLESERLIEIMTSLLATVKDLSIRPVVYPSALFCLTTSHRLIMLLDMIDISDNDFYNGTRENWIQAVKDLKRCDSKWAKLSNVVPSTLVRLFRTQLELGIMSIPDPNVSLQANDFSLPAIPKLLAPQDHDLPAVPCHQPSIHHRITAPSHDRLKKQAQSETGSLSSRQ